MKFQNHSNKVKEQAKRLSQVRLQAERLQAVACQICQCQGHLHLCQVLAVVAEHQVVAHLQVEHLQVVAKQLQHQLQQANNHLNIPLLVNDQRMNSLASRY
jgi:hypothetical protein